MHSYIWSILLQIYRRSKHPRLYGIPTFLPLCRRHFELQQFAQKFKTCKNKIVMHRWLPRVFAKLRYTQLWEGDERQLQFSHVSFSTCFFHFLPNEDSNGIGYDRCPLPLLLEMLEMSSTRGRPSSSGEIRHGLGFKPAKCHLTSPWNRLVQITLSVNPIEFWSFLQSKSINSVSANCFGFWERRPHIGAFPRTPGLQPPNKIPGSVIALKWQCVVNWCPFLQGLYTSSSMRCIVKLWFLRFPTTEM